MDETLDITPSPRLPTQRLFFALWPTDEERSALARWRDRLPDLRGRLVPAGNLHMTLAFAGNVDSETRDCLERRAAAVRGEACVLDMDRLGRFSRGLLWVGPRTCPAPLAELAQSLARVLQDCGLRPDPRPFHPHVTLARGTRNPLPEMSPPGGVWRLDAFCLVRSRPAQGYEVLKTYSLCGEDSGSLSEHSGSMK